MLLIYWNAIKIYWFFDKETIPKGFANGQDYYCQINKPPVVAWYYMPKKVLSTLMKYIKCRRLQYWTINVISLLFPADLTVQLYFKINKKKILTGICTNVPLLSVG